MEGLQDAGGVGSVGGPRGASDAVANATGDAAGDAGALAGFIPARTGIPVTHLEEAMGGVWRVRGATAVVVVDLDARTVVRRPAGSPKTGTGKAHRLDGVAQPLVALRSCEVAQPLEVLVRGDAQVGGEPLVISSPWVQYLLPVPADGAERVQRHLQALDQVVRAGGDAAAHRQAAHYFGARWSQIGQVYGLSGVQASRRWQEAVRAVLVQLRADRGEPELPRADRAAARAAARARAGGSSPRPDGSAVGTSTGTSAPAGAP